MKVDTKKNKYESHNYFNQGKNKHDRKMENKTTSVKG